MRIFLYEFITSGGMLAVAPHEVPSGSLLREGAAMFASLAEDLAEIPETEVVAMRDVRLSITDPPGLSSVSITNSQDEASHFDMLATNADWTIVIAPEFEKILLNRVRRIEELGGRLLGPNSRIVGLGTSKESTIAHLSIHGIRTPAGYRYNAGCEIPKTLRFPAVLKPDDGAGSQGVHRIERRESSTGIPEGSFRLEEFQQGTAASVAVVSGSDSRLVLPACSQQLAEDGSFQYVGGKVPLDEPLRSRAEQLALKVVRTLPNCLGYVGVDMILGASPDSDTVIELNPRLTTSYVGLRQLARGNLAAAIIELAEGKTPDLSFDAGPVEFSADGTIIHP
ncbi:MAG: ATP-grasp domain-containing protein [Planctomycetes bacterium]|nr:ATP-grasp domain-containing protein [Planctomycetota bacterium]